MRETVVIGRWDSAGSIAGRWRTAWSDHRLVMSATAIAAFLVAMNLLLGVFLYFGGSDSTGIGSVLRAFDLNSESPIPTWFAGALLLTSSVLLIRIALRTGGRSSIAWWGLALVFGYLAIDETLAIHERSIEPIREALDVGGIWYFAWVIPAIVVVIALGLAFIPLLRRLDAPVRRGFIIAGALYVGGALFLELVGGWLFDTYGAGMLTDITATVEETLEMTGVIVFISALLVQLVATPGRDGSSTDTSGTSEDTVPAA